MIVFLKLNEVLAGHFDPGNTIFYSKSRDAAHIKVEYQHLASVAGAEDLSETVRFPRSDLSLFFETN